MTRFTQPLAWLLCGLLLLMTALPAAAQPAPTPAGENADSQALTAAITAAKDILGLDTDTWDQFDYHSDTANDGSVRWNLIWSSSQNSSSLAATINEQGQILAYNHYSGSDQASGLANISRTQGQATAESFLRQIAPDIWPALSPAADSGHYYNSDTFTYTYQQYKDRLPIQNATVTVSVNKYSNTVSDYYSNDAVDFRGESYPDPQKAISLTEAKKAYLAQIGVELIYSSYYDYASKAYQVFPVYRLKNTSMAIDALTGEAIDTAKFAPFGYRSNMAQAEGAAAADGGSSLTPQEQAAVEQLSGLLSKEAAYDRLLAATSVSGSYTLVRSSLNSLYDQPDRYVWSFCAQSGDQDSDSYSEIYGAIDAQSGQLLSYNRYDNSHDSQPQLTLEQALTAANAFLAKNAAPQLASLALIPDENQKADSQRLYFQWQRTVDGVPFPNNGAAISYNSTTGDLESYRLTWHEGLAFPSVADAKTPAAIMEDIAANGQFQLMYVNGPQDNGLIYQLAKTGATYFDPFSGQPLNYRGQAYQEDQLPDYGDIGAAPWAKAAATLLENGIYLDIAPGETLNGSKAITQQALLTLLCRCRSPYRTFDSVDDLYDSAIRFNIITAAERQPEQLVTRQEAAKYMVRLLGYAPLAQRSGLFAWPYSDTPAAGWQGYLAIAGNLGLLSAQNNSLHPTDHLRLNDAFLAVYETAQQMR